jgi:uncharacterized protein (DUF1501 family)
MKRRTLLQAGLASLLLPGGRLYALEPARAKLLVVFLRGGYDAASALVPVASDDYYDARPSIAIGRREALPIDADWGLHPALKDTVHALWQGGEAAFVPFAGSDNGSRSHFETQDAVELGYAASGRKDYSTGFMNRLVAELGGARGIAFTEQLPLIFRGPARVPNQSLKNVRQAGVDARQSALIAEMYRETPLGQDVAQGFAARDEAGREMAAEEMNAASRSAPGPRSFELEARRIARLMKSGYGAGFVDLGGWDTHVLQGASAGQLANRLGELGRGLAGFAAEMGPAWREAAVVVISEFGRTFRENGNRGTDHGRASVLWVLGGALAKKNGARVAGEQVRVSRANLFQDRDFPVLNDYRAVLGGLFARLYGLDAARVERVFPGARPAELGIV